MREWVIVSVKMEMVVREMWGLFLFKQGSAFEASGCVVGSGMCIGDRVVCVGSLCGRGGENRERCEMEVVVFF